MQINGNYKSVSFLFFSFPLKFTHWSSKRLRGTLQLQTANSSRLRSLVVLHICGVWRDFLMQIVHVMKTEVEPQQTGFLFLNCTCLGGASVISKSGSFHCFQNKNWVITWYINAHNGYDQQHLQSEVTLKCLADVITAWFQTTSPKYYLPFPNHFSLNSFVSFSWEGLWKYLESQAFLSQTVQLYRKHWSSFSF